MAHITLAKRRYGMSDDGKTTIMKEWDNYGNLIFDGPINRLIGEPPKNPAESRNHSAIYDAVDDVLEKFINRPLKTLNDKRCILIQSKRDNDFLEREEWTYKDKTFVTEYFRNGKIKMQLFRRYRLWDPRNIKYFHENGVLAEVKYLDKKEIFRRKKWTSDGQLIEYEVFTYHEGVRKIHKFLKWYDDGKIENVYDDGKIENVYDDKSKIPIKTIDDVLEKFINKSLRVPFGYKLISDSYYKNDNIEMRRWEKDDHSIYCEYYENGKVKIWTSRNNEKEKYRFKRFFDDGRLEYVIIENKNIHRGKKWDSEGQLMLNEFKVMDNHKDSEKLVLPTDKDIFDIEDEKTKDMLVEAKNIHERTHINSLLREYARYGDVEAFKFLRDTYIGKNYSVWSDEILKIAAKHNHSRFLKYIRQEFGLTARNARFENNYALRISAEKGYYNILQELRKGYGLTASDATFPDGLHRNNCALALSAENLHLECLKEFREGYGLTTEDARANNNYILRYLCSLHNSQYCIRYMKEGFGLGAEDARIMDNYILRNSVKMSRISILKILRKVYGLGAEDARVQNNYALRYAARSGDQRMIQELKKFGLEKSDVIGNDNYVLKYLGYSYLKSVPVYDIGKRVALLKKGQCYHAECLRCVKRIFDLKKEDFECIEWDRVADAAIKSGMKN